MSSERGSALLEAVPVLLVLLTFTVGVMMTAYLLFAQVWLQHRIEQALYCIAEGQSTGRCRENLRKTVKEFLPWGEMKCQLLAFHTTWSAVVVWRLSAVEWRFYRQLTPESAVNKKALRWSRY